MRYDVVMRYAHRGRLTPREQERPAPVLLQAASGTGAGGDSLRHAAGLLGWWVDLGTAGDVPARVRRRTDEPTWQYRPCAYPRCGYAK